MTETIEKAAIKLKGIVWSVPKPGRHHDVIALVLRDRPKERPVGGVQGFVTSTGRFVDRETARRIADAADQIIASRIGPDGVPYKFEHRELFSEDVW